MALRCIAVISEVQPEGLGQTSGVFRPYMSSNINNTKPTPTILGTMEAVAPAVPTTMVTKPAAPAQFLGSFAAGSRQDDRKPAARRDIKSIVQHYFTEAWDDTNIWKSAVSQEFLSECGTPAKNG